jgi:trans-aconitate methyltransferase
MDGHEAGSPAQPPRERGDRWDAGLYDAKHSFVWKHGASMLDRLAPRAGERILDLGCGTGHLTAQIAELGAEVVGIDGSAAMIEQARRAYPGIRFEVADAREFVIPGAFDGVFSNAVLHWIKEPGRVAERVREALRPGGRFVAEFGGKGNVARIVAALGETAGAMGLGPWEDPWYFPSPGEYAALLENHGLEVLDASLFDRPTPLEGDAGMRNWVAMFAADLVHRVPEDRREEFFGRVEEKLRPALLRDGTWHAEYRRLRITALRAKG